MASVKHPPQSIIILRLSAIGDVSHTVPVVRALQQRWPQVPLTWIIGKIEHRLVGDLPGVEFIVFDKKGGLAAWRQLRRTLKGRQFDVLLQMQTAARANLLSLLIPTEARWGWDRARSRDRHHWFVSHQVRAVAQQHQVEGFLEFARAMDATVDEPSWDIPVSAADQAAADALLPGDAPTLLISPCSSHSARNWSVDGYARVADYASEHLGLRVALTGGPSTVEQEMGDAISRRARSELLNLIGRDTLKQSLALYRKAQVVIAPDSAPAHLASSVGTPVVGLYAATWSRRSGPYRSLNLCVDRFAEAAHQYRGKPPEALRWGTRIEEPGVMDLIDVESVIRQVQRAVTAAND